MGKMPQNIFFLDSLQVKWLLSYHGNRKECLEGSKKSSLIILGNVLQIYKVQTVYKNNNFVKSCCVLNTSDINQTSLFELKVGCLSHHITLTKESIKSRGFPRHVM